MFTGSNPVVMVSFSVNTGSTNTNAATIANQVSEHKFHFNILYAEI